MQDVPGVTRDRIAYDALWNGRRFTLVDTGGWEPDARGLQAMVSAQAERAVTTADLVLFVVDGRTGATGTDLAVARTLRRGSGPRRPRRHEDRRRARRGGHRRAVVTRAGRAVPGQRPARPRQRRPARRRPGAAARRTEGARTSRAARAGSRWSGSPTSASPRLLNRLTGEERSVVDAVAGTTIDPVDSLVELGGEVWRFVDTAGLRRRVRQAAGMEYYASLRTASAIEAAEVAVVLLDAGEPLSEQDQRVISAVIDAGRALVIAFNKWDLVDEDRASAARPRDRPGPGPGRSGRRGSTSPPSTGRVGGPAGGRAADQPGVLGPPHLHRPAQQLAHRGRRGDTAAAARRAGHRGCCSRRRPTPARRGSSCSPPGSSRRATAGSSSGGCARTSTSRARRSRSRCGSGPGTAATAEVGWRGTTGTWRSLVAHLTGGQGVVGSNPAVPTLAVARCASLSGLRTAKT